MSKYIDFILLEYNSLKIKHEVVINAFDITLSHNEILDKIKKFISEFLIFKDKNKTTITIDNQT